MSADPDLILLLVALAAFLVGGVIKGALGFGLPLLAIPAMTAAHSLPMALSIAIYPVFATNIWQTWSYRAHVPGRFLWGFLLAGAVGLFTGAILLGQIRDAYLEIAVGGLVLVYLAMRNRGKARQPTPERSRRFAPVFGFAAGAVHGATGIVGTGRHAILPFPEPRPAHLHPVQRRDVLAVFDPSWPDTDGAWPLPGLGGLDRHCRVACRVPWPVARWAYRPAAGR
jgi:uncharacterized membrane protein YfcA